MSFRISAMAALVGATALAAAPAQAQIFEEPDDLGTEEAIAGAIIVGGLAAILSGGLDGDDDDDYYYDRGYDGQYYGGQYRMNYAREAIERCVYVAENEARRWGPANVTEIEEVEQDGRFLRVEGDIRIAGTYRREGWNDYDYDDGDEGEFECYMDRAGRVVDIDFDGL